MRRWRRCVTGRSKRGVTKGRAGGTRIPSSSRPAIPSQAELPGTSGRTIELRPQPAFQHRDHVRLLLVGECGAPGNVVPLRETSSTARRGGVLRDEHRMSAKGRLLAVVERLSGCETPGDQVLGLDENGVEPVGL